MLRQPSLDQPVAMGLFHAQLDDFLAKAKEGIQRGEIPRTPINSRVVTDLGAMVRHIFDPNTTQGLMNDLVPSLKDMIAKFEIGDRLALRPEATASVVRAYIEHGMQTRPGNVKLYYVGPMFRRERPQKGRYRQFYQIGAELLGPSDHAALDAEVIEMLLAFFARVNLRGATLYINSIGDKNCRAAYVERLRGELQKVRETAGRGQPAADRDESAARAGFEIAGGAADHRDAAAHRGPSLRRLPGALRGAQAAAGVAQYRVRGELAAGARARLLHAHDLRDHGAGAGFAERGVRGRALRRVGGAAGRPGDDERDRVCDRHGPADAFVARGGGDGSLRPRSVRGLVWRGDVSCRRGVGTKVAGAESFGGVAGAGDEVRQIAEPGGPAGRAIRGDSGRGRNGRGAVHGEAPGGRGPEKAYGGGVAGIL